MNERPDLKTAAEKKLNAVARFSAKPLARHGAKRQSGASRGLHEHDWADLVGAIYWIDHQSKLDIEIAKSIARSLRKAFPNNSDWDINVNKQGAHELILEMIEEGLRNSLT